MVHAEMNDIAGSTNDKIIFKIDTGLSIGVFNDGSPSPS